jgi:hypothetical protein
MVDRNWSHCDGVGPGNDLAHCFGESFRMRMLKMLVVLTSTLETVLGVTQWYEKENYINELHF